MDDFTLAKIVRSDMLNKSFEAEIDTFHLFTSLVCIVKGVSGAGAYFIAHALMKFVRRYQCHVRAFAQVFKGMTGYDNFTTISNSMDTRGVCWLFGCGYCHDQNANKTRKKAESLKFEI